MSTLDLIPPPSGLLLRSGGPEAPRVRTEDRALPLMTDFRASPVVSLVAHTQIDRAIDHMIVAGVRMCFVVDTAGALIGAVTAADIQGEKPIRHLQSLGGGMRTYSRQEVEVLHVMEPLAQLKVVTMTEIARAAIVDVIAAMRGIGRRHLIVIESESGSIALRGVFSASHIERHIGHALDIAPAANTFAEIELAVEHPE